MHQASPALLVPPSQRSVLSRWARLSGFVLALGWAVQASPSRASDAVVPPVEAGQEASPGSGAVTVARQQFAHGVELYRAGAYDAALAAFTRAYELAPTYRILYNLAQVQAQRQDYV